MNNQYRTLRDLLAPGVLQIGVVTRVNDGQIGVQLPGGAIVHARGNASISDRVYIKDAVIQGLAPDLPTVTGEI